MDAWSLLCRPQRTRPLRPAVQTNLLWPPLPQPQQQLALPLPLHLVWSQQLPLLLLFHRCPNHPSSTSESLHSALHSSLATATRLTSMIVSQLLSC